MSDDEIDEIMKEWNREHGPSIRGALRRDGAKTHDVEEIEQVLWLKQLQLLRDGKLPRSKDATRSWLTTIAVRLWRDVRRNTAVERMRRKPWDLSVEDDITTQPADELAQAELRQTLDHALSLLDRRLERVVRLRFLKGYSFAELAAEFDRPVSTMWDQYRRALAELRAILENHRQDLQFPERQYKDAATNDYRGLPLP
jgi:RNA polymerase sigma factor (sigma-70 family)